MKLSFLLITCFCFIAFVQGEGLRSHDRMLALDNLEDGTYIITVIGTGKVFDISGESKKAAADLIQYTPTGRANQKFQVKKQSSGTYKIYSVHSGLILDVNGASYSSGAKIIQWINTGQANQEWRINTFGTCYADSTGQSSCTITGYQMTSVNSGLIVSVAGGSSSDGAQIIQASNPPQGSYLLRFTKI